MTFSVAERRIEDKHLPHRHTSDSENVGEIKTVGDRSLVSSYPAPLLGESQSRAAQRLGVDLIFQDIESMLRFSQAGVGREAHPVESTFEIFGYAFGDG